MGMGDWFDAKPPRLPNATDPAFGPRRDDWPLNARVNWTDIETQWAFHADSFKDGADQLVSDLLERRGAVDTMVYPIVFQYRHYIEAKLKEILVLSSAYNGTVVDSTIGTHNLIALWKLARTVIEGLFPNHAAVLDGAEHIIKEFAIVDPGSFSFRYPVEKDFKTPTLPAGLLDINVGQVRDRVEELSTVLGAATDQLSAGLEGRRGAGAAYLREVHSS